MSDLFPEINDWPGKRPPKNRTDKVPAVAPQVLDMSLLNPKKFRIRGEDVELFTIGDISLLLGKKPVTIRMWESNGWIPRANWRSPAPKGEQIPGRPAKGRRLYSRPQVELLFLASQQFRLDSKKDADYAGFRQYVKTHWPI